MACALDVQSNVSRSSEIDGLLHVFLLGNIDNVYRISIDLTSGVVIG
jgi:hypothetical protein